MKCFIEDFRELDIDELLAVNGGYGSGSAGSYGKNSGGGGGGSGSYGSSSGSNSSSDTSWEVWVNNKDSRNKEGDITRYHDPNRDSPSNSGSYKGTSFVPEGNIGNNSGKKVLDFESVLEDLLNGQAQDTGDKPAVNSGDEIAMNSGDETAVNSGDDTGDVTAVNSEDVEPSTFEQRDFTEEYGENFGNNACAATSLLNEISEEYTEQTGKQLTKEQAEEAMAAAVEGGYIDSNDAFVNDWEGAADEMWESTGLDGDFVYNESEDADHIIYAQDTKGGPGVDHFVNSTEPGQYYDPWTGETCDLDTSILQENRPIRGLDFVE